MMIIKDPIEFKPTVPLTSHKWNILRDLWSQTGIQSLTFTFDPEGWCIAEIIDNVTTFRLRRDPVTLNRYTDVDIFGLLGLSLLDLSNDTVFITEGVSDYISAKLCLPNENVLGVTQLGGSAFAKQILISLFTNIVIIADHDPAGMTAAIKWKSLFASHSIPSKVWQTSTSQFKDFTDEFLFNLKIDNTVQF